MNLQRPIRVLLVAMLLATPLVFAQPSSRIGYVDFDRVADNAPQIARGKALLEEEFRPRNEQLQEDEDRLLRLEERLVRDAPFMTSQQVEALELEVRSLRRQVQNERDDLADEVNFRLNEVQKDVEEEIGDIVRRFAEDNGYDLILVTHILYVSDAVDITDEVIAILQREYGGAGGEVRAQ